MLPNQSKGRGDAPAGQAAVGRELDFGFEPELRFPRGVLHMDVHPSLFPRKEVEPISSTAEDGRTHETIIPNPSSRALGRPNYRVYCSRSCSLFREATLTPRTKPLPQFPTLSAVVHKYGNVFSGTIEYQSPLRRAQDRPFETALRAPSGRTDL